MLRRRNERAGQPTRAPCLLLFSPLRCSSQPPSCGRPGCVESIASSTVSIAPARRRARSLSGRRQLGAVEPECSSAAGTAAKDAYDAAYLSVAGFLFSTLTTCACTPPIPADANLVAATTCEIEVGSNFGPSTSATDIQDAHAAAQSAAHAAIESSVDSQVTGALTPSITTTQQLVTQCLPGFWGAACTPCACGTGLCMDGREGDGTCRCPVRSSYRYLNSFEVLGSAGALLHFPELRTC